MSVLRLAAVHLRVVALNEMQYRANFFFQLLQSLVALSVGLAVLLLVLSKVEQIRGWSGPQLIAVLGTFTILGGVIRMLLRPNLVRFMEDVHEGTLDYVLTKPVDAQLLTSIRAVHLWQGVDIAIGCALLVVAATRLEVELGFLDVLGFALCLVLAVIVMYGFLTILATSAFQLIYVEPILELFEGVYQAGRWPITIYPGWLRVGLTVVVPIGVAVTVPAEAVTGRLSGTTLAAFAGLAVVTLVIARLVWKAGLRRYRGASA